MSDEIDELERVWKKTGDIGVLRVLLDAHYDLGLEPPIASVEHGWKRARNPEVERQLVDLYVLTGKDPEVELARLKDEVEAQVRKEVIEELSGEHGNLNSTPWRIHTLSDELPYVPRGERPPQPDYVTPEGLELFIRTRDADQHWTMDYPPEHMQQQLEREHGHDAEFVTVLDQVTADYIADAKTGDVYQFVSGDALGERECPFMNWNPELNEDERDRVVTEGDTWFGEHPGRWCRYCEAEIGEEHGYIYLGEEAREAVYLKLVAEPLRSTVDSPEVEREVTEAFQSSGLVQEGEESDVFYEHGQWWARVWSDEEDRDRTYSVVDQERGHFDFEEV